MRLGCHSVISRGWINIYVCVLSDATRVTAGRDDGLPTSAIVPKGTLCVFARRQEMHVVQLNSKVVVVTVAKECDYF
jgi:hypothetical protein